jgi:hypothetical protein
MPAGQLRPYEATKTRIDKGLKDTVTETPTRWEFLDVKRVKPGLRPSEVESAWTDAVGHLGPALPTLTRLQ